QVADRPPLDCPLPLRHGIAAGVGRDGGDGCSVLPYLHPVTEVISPAPGHLRQFLAAGGGFGRLASPLDNVKKPVRVILEPAIAQLKSIEPRKLVQLGRQLLLPRRAGAVNKYRNHPHAALKRSLDLEAHEVMWIVEPRVALLIGERRPLAPDQ